MIKLADTLTPMSNDFYAVESENVGINIDGTSKSIQQAYEDGDLSGGGSAIQVDLLPPPSVDELGKIYEFIGSTGTYVNGYFYECVSDGEPTPTYSWVQKNVQPNAKSFTFNEDDFNIDSSTDKVSLLPSRRVFNGSKVDWDLLSVAEKTQYGATAFTDDEGGDSVEDIPITQNTGSGFSIVEIKAIRTRNIVSVVGIVEVRSQLESVVVATGFPTPLIIKDTVNNTQLYLSGQRGTNSDGQSARITKNGELIIYTSTSGGNYYFSGTYVV